ncbi:MAG: hypothetical protein DRI57_30970 [Deltaproteobacteria bacterium]|nr:MAG: hypothetical protein DRI57_30970 [Deltaproteobacteria bacterium]
MLDVSVSYDRYKFLGYEFLTWLWFLIEKDQNKLKELDRDLMSLEIGNRIVLENRFNDAVESITIKGDDAGLEEGILALRKGSVVTELNLVYRSGDHEWRFNIKGESFNIGNLRPPDTGPVESKDDIEGAILEKAYLYEKSVVFIDAAFKGFIRLRLSKNWNENVVPLLKQWIYS